MNTVKDCGQCANCSTPVADILVFSSEVLVQKLSSSDGEQFDEFVFLIFFVSAGGSFILSCNIIGIRGRAEMDSNGSWQHGQDAWKLTRKFRA